MTPASGALNAAANRLPRRPLIRACVHLRLVLTRNQVENHESGRPANLNRRTLSARALDRRRCWRDRRKNFTRQHSPPAQLLFSENNGFDVGDTAPMLRGEPAHEP